MSGVKPVEKTTARKLIDQIQSAQDLKTSEVEVPEWGVTLSLCEMTGMERAEFESSYSGLEKEEGTKGAIKSMAYFICASAIDENGDRWPMSNAEILQGKSFTVLERVFKKALSLNKMTDEDITELEKK